MVIGCVQNVENPTTRPYISISMGTLLSHSNDPHLGQMLQSGRHYRSYYLQLVCLILYTNENLGRTFYVLKLMTVVVVDVRSNNRPRRIIFSGIFTKKKNTLALTLQQQITQVSRLQIFIILRDLVKFMQ